MKDEKEAVVFRKNIDTIATWSVFSGSSEWEVFLILISSTSKEVKGAGIIFFILCGMEGSYFLLFLAQQKELL